MKRRVVVTGMSGLSPLGTGWKAVRESLLGGRSGVQRIDAWDEVESLRTRPVDRIPSYEEPGAARRGDRTIGEDSIEQLRSLGYVE